MKTMTFIPMAAVLALAFSPVAAGDCEFDAILRGRIGSVQAELGDYRACLETITADTELDKATRKAALDKFNDSVDMETAMVEDWQAFRAARKEAQG